MSKHLDTRFTLLASAAVLLAAAVAPASAEVVVRGKEGKPLDEIRRAPGSIYPDLRTIVAQPSPSEIKPEFLGPVVLMKSAHIDLEKGTATLPLRKGKLKNGTPVWFIITDTTDENLSNLHGVNYAPKMAYGLTGVASRHATIEKDGSFTFATGSVDFKPVLGVTPGPANAPFPPAKFQPGSVGDATYTPMVYIDNSAKGVLMNAPVVSQATEAELNTMCDGNVDHSKVHDKVLAICPRDETVTLSLTLGFTFDKPIQYLSTEANNPLVAALENATFAPALADLPFALEDASPGESAERIVVVVNGPTGLDNPHRQGLVSALTDGRGPLNILGGIPTINLDYSPMWRLFPAVWTDEAIKKGYRYRMTSALQAAEMSTRGLIKSLDGGDFRAVGFVVNCPVVYRIN
ncbi:MAG: hypothetical protein K2W81_00445 [Sphingomonas sp.]|uniref:hypothetical protein n=1 Tax=Sphingomonas sp. TaxID=28214 RepID=UPI0025F6257B|nr:hypothetical protein [Sphingomonas sp.]MBY0282410.1 hypothetical protein [Sphingomonas sp.]